MDIYFFIGIGIPLVSFMLGMMLAQKSGRSHIESQINAMRQNVEDRYNSILEYASIGMASIALDGRILKANTAFCEILGYPENELEGKLSQDIIHPDDLAVKLFNVARLLSSETSSYQLENRFLRRDGSITWVLLTESLFRDEQNRPLHLTAQIQDITERKRVEQSSRENEYRLRTMLDNVPARISYWNSELHNEMANNGYEEWFGFTPEQMLGRHMRDIIGEERYRRNLPHLQGVLGGDPQLFERASVDRQGIEHYIQVSYTPDISGGKVKGFFVLVTDITQRRNAEQALKESELRFRKVLENAPIGMALLSLDGNIRQANQAFSRLCGYSSEELRNLTFRDITHPDDTQRYLEVMNRLKAGDTDSYEIEKRYIHKNGHAVWVQVTASLLRDDIGVPQQIIKQVQDITERKKLESDLERQAHTDYLTGLVNRRHFLELADHELAHVRRYGGELSVAMLDLDHFKSINDTHGHHTGDQVLKELAHICHKTLRKVDIPGRLGGEEFAILFPETGIQEAYDIVERLREAISKTEIPLDHGSSFRFTASIGIASFTPADSTIEMLIKRADAALYEAKISGRNRISEAVGSYK